MRPIKLEIEGLNSFESNQILEFDKLGDGVFGIFGNTGSGKSTILDAITLALYGKIERSKQNIDFINIKRQKAIVSLIFEISHCGKQKIFQVDRTFSKKKSGKLIDSSASLYEIIGDEKTLVEEGTIKVNDKIFSIIGLGVNEFAKCIALPQGEFSAFLQAKPSERIEIMSNIFNLSKYGDSLSFAVKERLNEYDKEVSVLTASKMMLEGAGDDTLAEMQKVAKETRLKYELRSNVLMVKSEELAKAQEAIKQQEAIAKIKTELNELELQKEEIEKLKEQTTKSQNANEIKTDFLKLKKTQQDEKELSEKIANLNELRLQKQSEMQRAEQEFGLLKEVYETKILELNKKIAILEELENSDSEIENLKKEQDKLSNEIEQYQKLLANEQENNAYIDSLLEKLIADIKAVEELINKQKPEVEKCYALEQVKDIESEFILIEDFYNKIENLVNSLEIDLKNYEEEYNQAIKTEKQLREKQEEIKKSFKVVFEDEYSQPFEKLRGCDKELLAINDAENIIAYLENTIERLSSENNSRLDIIAEVRIKIEKANQNLVEYEKVILDKNCEIENLSEIREEMLGENVISLISDNLKIGDFCPVCSSRVIQKIYSEKNNLQEVENSISDQRSVYKNMLINRDKLLAEVFSLKSRLEFEKAQIESNDAEIQQIKHDIARIYQKFVDDNDNKEENFEQLKSLIIETSTKLEDLILMQERLRDEELAVSVHKAQYGTKIVDTKSVLEQLYEVIYDLQKKKAEREFVMLNSAAELDKIDDYKKFVADGKALEIELDANVSKRQSLRDEQLRLMQDKAVSDRKILEIKSNIQVLSQKLEGDEKQISSLISKALTSGVPEGVSVAEEKEFTKEALLNLKKDYIEKQSAFETNKEAFLRIENDYKINTSILQDKQKEMKYLKDIIENNMIKFNFSSNEDIENNFAENVEIRHNLEKINNFNNKLNLMHTQKEQLEKEFNNTVDEKLLNELKVDVEALNEEVKLLSEEVGRQNARLEAAESDNKKLKDIEKSLCEAQKKYDTAKELSSVLRGKALAEYFCEEYLQEITDSANSKLELLMDGRYTLRFEDKEFFVEDNFSDGIVRSASTLSGGETFIVSLSLALSISDAIAMLSSRSIDFFFLDEGFGTLDAELCSIVVSALHKLESQNLKIGLISHIAELSESIKNKIIVTKDANGSKIRIEHSL